MVPKFKKIFRETILFQTDFHEISKFCELKNSNQRYGQEGIFEVNNSNHQRPHFELRCTYIPDSYIKGELQLASSLLQDCFQQEKPTRSYIFEVMWWCDQANIEPIQTKLQLPCSIGRAGEGAYAKNQLKTLHFWRLQWEQWV